MLCNGDINGYDTCTGCYGSAGTRLHNNLEKKCGKAYVVIVVPVAMPLKQFSYLKNAN